MDKSQESRENQDPRKVPSSTWLNSASGCSSCTGSATSATTSSTTSIKGDNDKPTQPPTTWPEFYQQFKNREAEYRKYEGFMKNFSGLCAADERRERFLNTRRIAPPPGFGTEKFELLEKFKAESMYFKDDGEQAKEKPKEPEVYKFQFRPGGKVTIVPKPKEDEGSTATTKGTSEFLKLGTAWK